MYIITRRRVLGELCTTAPARSNHANYKILSEVTHITVTHIITKALNVVATRLLNGIYPMLMFT